jgi:uncharacterized protein (TIGR02246 family)
MEKSIVDIANDEERAAAESMMKCFVDAWNRADGEAYGQNYWPDAELVDPTGTIWDGRAAIAQMHVDLWTGPFKGTHLDAQLRRIRRVDTNCLLVDLDLALRGARQAPPGAVVNAQGVIQTHLKHILVKRSEVWRIVSAQNTFVMSR